VGENKAMQNKTIEHTISFNGEEIEILRCALRRYREQASSPDIKEEEIAGYACVATNILVRLENVVAQREKEEGENP